MSALREAARAYIVARDAHERAARDVLQQAVSQAREVAAGESPPEDGGWAEAEVVAGDGVTLEEAIGACACGPCALLRRWQASGEGGAAALAREIATGFKSHAEGDVSAVAGALLARVARPRD